MRETKGHDKDNEVGSSDGTHMDQREERGVGQARRSIVPRYSKLEFPSYDGVNDPLIWIYKCEQFFEN